MKKQGSNPVLEFAMMYVALDKALKKAQAKSEAQVPKKVVKKKKSSGPKKMSKKAAAAAAAAAADSDVLDQLITPPQTHAI